MIPTPCNSKIAVFQTRMLREPLRYGTVLYCTVTVEKDEQEEIEAAVQQSFRSRLFLTPKLLGCSRDLAYVRACHDDVVDSLHCCHHHNTQPWRTAQHMI